MGVFSLFSSNKFSIETFEKELNDIYSSINKKNQEIIRLNQVKKSVVKNLYFYASIAFTLYVSVLIVRLPYNSSKINVFKWFILNQLKEQLLTLLGIPVITYAVKFLFTYLIDVLIKSRDKSVRSMKKKQKEKIDELKKLTNFNTTNELLNKYDSKKPKPQAKPTEKVPPKTSVTTKPQQNTGKPGAPVPAPVSGAVPTPNGGISSNKLPNSGPFPPNIQSPQKRTIQDRIFDLLIGSEDDSIENRYALICRKCYGHCGLAPPNTKDPQSIKYICPFCKTLNGEEFDLASMMKDTSPAAISPVATSPVAMSPVPAVSPAPRPLSTEPVEDAPVKPIEESIEQKIEPKEGPEAEITS